MPNTQNQCDSQIPLDLEIKRNPRNTGRMMKYRVNEEGILDEEDLN